MLGGVASEDEEKLLQTCNAWVIRCGLPAGEMNYELTEPESGEALAVIDLAWPDGLQSGLSDPVALLIDEDADIERIVNGAGYRSFTSLGAFQHYVGGRSPAERGRCIAGRASTSGIADRAQGDPCK